MITHVGFVVGTYYIHTNIMLIEQIIITYKSKVVLI